MKFIRIFTNIMTNKFKFIMLDSEFCPHLQNIYRKIYFQFIFVHY